MNSNPGTHNGMAGLEKEVHRSTDRVHPEKAGTSLSQAAATGCLAQLSEVTIRVLLAQRAAFAKWVLVNFEWGTLVEKYQCKESACLWNAACCMTH